MAISYKLLIDSTAVLDPNDFQVDEEATTYTTIANTQGDEIVLEHKQTNYVKATINITWEGIPVDYANAIAALLATTSFHTIQRGNDSWGGMKMVSFSKSLIDDFRHEAKKDNYYYNISCTLKQYTSGLLTS